MLSKEISSLQHEIVKHFVNLRKNRHYRIENNAVCISGSTVIKELASNFTFKTLLLEKGLSIPKSLKAEKIYYVSEKILKKISGLETSQEMIAEIPMPRFESLKEKSRILILDEIKDPGNLGTLIRSACGLGWSGVFLSDLCCDPFNDKALRASKGSVFKIPLEQNPLSSLQNDPRQFYVADPRGTPLNQIQFKQPMALILGNEVRGASPLLKKRSIPVSIPMSSSTESLNVACAGSILLYELIRSCK